MKKLALFSLISLMVVMVSCVKENPDRIVKFQVNTDSLELNQRISYPMKPITLKQKKSSESVGFMLVGDAQSPEINGMRLSASSVIFANNKAYVTYNLRGEEFGGAIVVYNLSNTMQPTINSQIIFEDIDINIASFKKNTNTIYLGGSHRTLGGVVIPVSVNGQGGINTSQNLQMTPMGEAPSVNGVVHVGNRLIVSAGNTNGGFWSVNQGSLGVADQFLIDGAKSVVYNEGKSANNDWFVGLVAPGPNTHAQLRVWKGGNNPSFAQGRTINIGISAYHQSVEPDYDKLGKLYMYIAPNSNICYIPLGANGMRAFDISPNATSTGPVYQSPANMLTIGNTNAVSVDNHYIYLANGADGVLFGKKPASGTVIDVFGVWDNSEYPGSANFVASNNTHVFVAKGKEGGLKILLKMF